ncbi:MAG: hypothetical protein AAGI38_19350 [Bacteroidota bacterium]
MSQARLVFFIAAMLLLFVGTGCQNDQPGPSMSLEVSGFPDSVNVIMEQNCAISGCHVGANPPSDLNLESWTQMHDGSDFGTVAIPGWPDWSHVFMHSNTFEELGVRALPPMPFNSDDQLTRQQVRTLRNWINDGVLSDKGESYWAHRRTTSEGKGFFLCAGSDLFAVTDLESNLIMDYVSVGNNPAANEAPHFIVSSPDNQYVYITLLTSGDSAAAGSAVVEKYRTDNYQLAGRVFVDPDPALIQMNQDGDRMVVTHWNSAKGLSKLTLVDTRTMEVIAEATGDGTFLSRPHGMAATPDLSTLYVVANTGNYYSKITILDDRFDPDDEKIRIDPSVRRLSESDLYKPYHCLLIPEKNMFFVSCNHKDINDVRVFDTRNDSLIAIIKTGELPRLMDYDPQSNRLFVACGNEENFAEQGSLKGCVSVIDVASLTLEKKIFRIGQRPHGIKVDPKRRRLYVSTENNGGEDPPHHFIEGQGAGVPGKYNVIDLNTLEVIEDMETEVPVSPNQLVLIP